MRTTIIIALFAFLLVASKADWNLVWADDFDFFDDSKWQYEYGDSGWGNNELENYTDQPDNIFTQDGNLIIQANRNDDGSYTSARINTAGKFETTYGKFEMRAKLPSGQGIWPAFWLLGANIGENPWPGCGEIDIMELVGNDPTNVHGSTHGNGFDTTSTYSGEGFTDDFHTYAAIWQPGQIDFLVDDNVYNTVTYDDTNGGEWPFDDNPMFIILNLAVGGDWPGNPDDSTEFPQQYVIDYVHVYQE